MTNIPIVKVGPKRGTIVVRVTDIEEWEKRWQDVRDNQVSSMNNLLARIDELTGTIDNLREKLAMLKDALKASEASRLASEKKLAELEEK